MSFLHSCNVGYSAMEEIKENQLYYSFITFHLM